MPRDQIMRQLRRGMDEGQVLHFPDSMNDGIGYGCYIAHQYKYEVTYWEKEPSGRWEWTATMTYIHNKGTVEVSFD